MAATSDEAGLTSWGSLKYTLDISIAFLTNLLGVRLYILNPSLCAYKPYCCVHVVLTPTRRGSLRLAEHADEPTRAQI
jgi:hypothetical protein